MAFLIYIIAMVIMFSIFWLGVNLLYKFNKRAALLVSFFLIVCGIGIVIFPLILKKYTAEVQAEAKKKTDFLIEVQNNPCDENVDKLIETIEKDGGVITNNPANWNTFRGLWFVYNESKNVTTEKKYQLRNWLMMKGLRITGQDKEVRDNYGK